MDSPANDSDTKTKAIAEADQARAALVAAVRDYNRALARLKKAVAQEQQTQEQSSPAAC
jgi:hypothetical protein